MVRSSLGSLDDLAAFPSPPRSCFLRSFSWPSGSWGVGTTMTGRSRRLVVTTTMFSACFVASIVAFFPVSIAASASHLSSSPELRRAVRPAFLRAEEEAEDSTLKSAGEGRLDDDPLFPVDPDGFEGTGDDHEKLTPLPADSRLRYNEFPAVRRLKSRNPAGVSNGEGASNVDALTSSLSRLSSPPFARSGKGDATQNPAPFGDDHPMGKVARSLTSRLRKTGTTIAGCLCENGTAVVIGADTRATEGTTVADKRCEKIHRLASDNVWCAGAGTSADVDALVRRVRYTFKLRGALDGCIGNDHYGDKESPPANVPAVVRCLREELHANGGNLGANLIVGGYDVNYDRATLTAVHPHGSVDYVPYSALGSGGLAAMAVLESGYSDGLTLEEARDLITRAIVAGIENDLGSGSQVDMCVIGRDGVSRYDRAVVEEQSLPALPASAVTSERVEGGDEGQLGGVNGFGTMPYAIKSRRVVIRSEEAEEDDRRRWRRDVLGLPQRLDGEKG